MKTFYYLYLKNYLTCELHIADAMFFGAIFTKKYILYYQPQKRALLTNFYLLSFLFSRVYLLLKQVVQLNNSIVFITDQSKFSYLLNSQSIFNYNSNYTKIRINPNLLNTTQSLFVFFGFTKKVPSQFYKTNLNPVIFIGNENEEFFKKFFHPVYFIPIYHTLFSHYYFYLILLKYFLQNILVNNLIKFSIFYQGGLKNHF